MSTSAITHVGVEAADHGGYCLHWQTEDVLWHAWLNEQLVVVAGIGAKHPTLYKVADPKGAPRRLDATKPANAKMIGDAHAVALGAGMYVKAKKALADRERKEAADLDAKLCEDAKRSAAGAMFEALTAIKPLIADWANDPTKNWAHRQVEDAISKALPRMRVGPAKEPGVTT